MRFLKLIFLFLFCSSIPIFSSEFSPVKKKNQNFEYSLFIENKGQWPDDVLYLSKIGGINTWITRTGVVYDYYRIDRPQNKEFIKTPHSEIGEENISIRIRGEIVKITMVHTNSLPLISAKNKQKTYFNYFIGNEPSKWANYVGLYKEVKLEEVYDGIDIRYYFDEGLIRYDYIVKPGADPNQIKLKLEGPINYYVNKQGELEIETNIGKVKHGRLLTYQGDQSNEIQCHFIINEDRSIGIKLAKYDKNLPLIIDPLVYSTFIGGSDTDAGNSLILDSENNAYITGKSRSSDFPTTVGAYNESFNGDQDIIISKFDGSGTNLIYSTYIGGSQSESGNSIVLDSEKNIYVTGYTQSSDFPTSTDAFDKIQNGEEDAFILKLNSSGSDLIYSTFIGGSNSEDGYSLALDSENNAYITGQTYSNDFPTTIGAFNESKNDTADVFVCKLNSSGSNLIYSSFIGGDNIDQGSSITLDNEKNAYIGGRTYSDNFPTTTGAFDETFNGSDSNTDIFVCKLNSSGSNLVYSTYLGGTGFDTGGALALDSENNVYIYGHTDSDDFPTTSGAFSETPFGDFDIFISKLDATGSNLTYSSYIGGTDTDYSGQITLDNESNVYIIGTTYSNDFPITSGSYDESFNGDADIFYSKLNSSCSDIIYSTYIGGSDREYGNSIILDSVNEVYLSGRTRSSDFPTTDGSFDQTINGSYDAFVLKLTENPNSIKKIPNILNKFNIEQNYPNPFNPVTTIKYFIPEFSEVHISVYNLNGQKIEDLVNTTQSAGDYQIEINCDTYSSGIYFYAIFAHSLNGSEVYRSVKKMVLLK